MFLFVLVCCGDRRTHEIVKMFRLSVYRCVFGLRLLALRFGAIQCIPCVAYTLDSRITATTMIPTVVRLWGAITTRTSPL